MKRLACGVGAALAFCGIAWLFGFDFDERGTNAGFVALYCLIFGGAAYFYAGLK